MKFWCEGKLIDVQRIKSGDLIRASCELPPDMFSLVSLSHRIENQFNLLYPLVILLAQKEIHASLILNKGILGNSFLFRL